MDVHRDADRIAADRFADALSAVTDLVIRPQALGIAVNSPASTSFTCRRLNWVWSKP